MSKRMLIAAMTAGPIAAGVLFALWPEQPLPAGTVADRLVVDKSARRLAVLSDDETIKIYRVSLGRVPTGAKVREGDGKTPEGRYIIDARKADSAYHRALHISYPDADDRRHAAALGTSPGGAIMIHGLPNGLGWIGRFQRLWDWTQGCVALTDGEIDELWDAVPVGTPVEIRP